MRRADHLSRGVLPSVFCLSVVVKHLQFRKSWPIGSSRAMREKMRNFK